jgi:hypothetical protein
MTVKITPKQPSYYPNYDRIFKRGRQGVRREAHNLITDGSSPSPATTPKDWEGNSGSLSMEIIGPIINNLIAAPPSEPSRATYSVDQPYMMIQTGPAQWLGWFI